MQYIVDTKQMKAIEKYNIEELGIPSLVLMEKAANHIYEAVLNRIGPNDKVLIVCGNGNNGADGIATARMLYGKNVDVTIFLAMDDKKHTKEYDMQLDIVKKIGVKICNKIDNYDYDIIVDALFGIGLTRDIEGDLAAVVNSINDSRAYVISVDIPSGINGDNGKVCNVCVKADELITFGYSKLGLCLHPAKDYYKKITCADIGLIDNTKKVFFMLEENDMMNIPLKPEYCNKGSFGKALIIAGSKDIYGALELAAKAAFNSGVSYLKVFTQTENGKLLKAKLPEAVINVYNEFDEVDASVLDELLEWSTHILIGPGISKNDAALKMLKQTLSKKDKTIVCDADALNLMAANKYVVEKCQSKLIFTPHILEGARMLGKTRDEVLMDIVSAARNISEEYNGVCVLKDAYTTISNTNGDVCLNYMGVAGMAKAGSGDVLAGIILGLTSIGMNEFDGAMYGDWIHKKAGLMAQKQKTQYSMTASTIIEHLPEIFGGIER